jgi:predicted enzyme related to lactoylglutathione lyase
MHGNITHFAINADDLSATRRFYEGVFGWTFSEYAPGFIRTRSAGLPIGAIQERRSLVSGERTVGFECTFEVDDVERAVSSAAASGGRVVMPPAAIPDAGTLVFLADPSGNVVGAMRYEA